jgi:hypothetical protein
MTTLNKELFAQDPTTMTIPNEGVAKVARPVTDDQWRVLEWELRSFVCEGEYERGLERILDSFLTNLGKVQQPAVWISGFYGSGKSHLGRVLEYLWRDVTLPSGESARSLVDLPTGIEAHLRELSMAGKRFAGLWSAAGTLGSGRSQSVRLAFLSVLFDSAGLPPQYPHARFTLWAHENGYLEAIRSAVEAAGKRYDHEVVNLYASPIIAQALLESDPTLGESVTDVRHLLRDQFPSRSEDVTDEEMLTAVEDVLRLQSDTEGRYPLTLVLLDEMQQYLGDDHAKTLTVQNIVEHVSSRFDNSVLFVATGQSAMGATPTLQKLTDRFPVHVHLSDKDVETVVRQVILRKQPDRRGELEEVLREVSGEMDRHLAGTKIGPVAADKQNLVADYPLLPTRRRFWTLALQALDRAGKAGVLRTQLRIVHEATKQVADEPVGYVVGADFLYGQQEPSLLQSGALLKEISEWILAMRQEGEDGQLKARICALIFLITAIPEQMGTDTGLRATAPFLADLLIKDLRHDGVHLRKRVPELLDELVDDGRLMRVDDQYRLQTEEGVEWEKDYRGRLAAIRDDASKLANLRTERLQHAVDAAIGNLRLTHGHSRTPRKINVHLGTHEPKADEADIPIWIRDEWTVRESDVRDTAAQAGEDSPVVHVLLPKRDAETIKDALASHAATQGTVHSKPRPQTEEGREAQRAMESRATAQEERLDALVSDVVDHARVYQGGGTPVPASTFREAVELAAQHSLVRLFPKFEMADDLNWGKVITKARDGAPDALEVLGYGREPTSHPVCKEVLVAVSPAGTTGATLERKFSSPPYGWPQDAIRGAVMALLATRHIRATREGVNVAGPKELEQRQIGKTTFQKEDEPPSHSQRLAVRGLLAEAHIFYDNGQEQTQIPTFLQKLTDIASSAGGPPPLPTPPDTSHVEELRALGGNHQFRQVAEASEQLKADLAKWGALADRREDRQQKWATLKALLHHARSLEAGSEVAQQRDAIHEGRQLLDDPDPVRPLLEAIAGPLRDRVVAAADELQAQYEEAIADLEASAEWQQVDTDQRSEIIAEVGLQRPREIDVSTQDKLLATLNDTPLDNWNDKVEVMWAHARKARTQAARHLEPTAVQVSLDAVTLKTEAEADVYLQQIRTRIVEQLEEGHTVII